ncbi:stage V sporulation protein AE [Evansella cellulosilytica]|uniref:Stage V sporulation protein AE n=1 Tax=Evansella cellulosilytica (strain ATCC 21833 / DSM 2522 / FERM P-1141 / JCM 9156 / N-4) TaxID=649639 RepID=E6TYL0_EVAC2|nr:stage V sporulation protein AE [Evansella cellulosilytica]ADU30060.1 stage V sporulation protein AE [Evansella cellulosilytica DSM 2522]
MKLMKQVILVTDGDASAREAVDYVSKELQCELISESSGNPTRINSDTLIQLILNAKKDLVLVLFDDCGFPDEGPGESVLIDVVQCPNIKILGAIAVASQSYSHEWTRIDVSIDRNGTLTEFGVDKDGIRDTEVGRLRGDTVSVLDQLSIPMIVGIGDIGKMGGKDAIKMGAPITKQAIELIIERSGYNGSSTR